MTTTDDLADILIRSEAYAAHPHLQMPLAWQAVAVAAARGYPVGICTTPTGVGLYIDLPAAGRITWCLHPTDHHEPLGGDRCERVWEFAAYERATRANGLPYFNSHDD